MLLLPVAPRHARGLAAVVVGAVIALVPTQVVRGQLTEAVTRARKAAEQGNQRTQAVDAQAQQATQDGKKAPAPPAGSKGAQPTGSAPAGAAQSVVPKRPVDTLRASGRVPVARNDGSARGDTHTVETGETLWGIAQRYLQDPYLWPEIYRLNTDVVEDPKWIYPGEVLKLPGAAPSAAIVAAAPAPLQGTVDEEPQVPEGATVFSSVRRVATIARRRASVVTPSPAVRTGEYAAAPFATASKGPAWSGRVLESLSSSSIGMDRRDRAIQFAERVSVTPPSGAPAQPGTRYLIIRPAGTVPGVGDIAIPTGVIDIEEVERGKAPVGRITKVFDAIRSGQGLIPFERLRVDSLARPAPVANGALTSVVWLLADPVLPTLQAYIVLNAKGISAPHIGDVYALLGPSTKTPSGVNVPEEVIGSAQVVRITPQGLTAVITGQKTGAIREGMQARLAARMP